MLDQDEDPVETLHTFFAPSKLSIQELQGVQMVRMDEVSTLFRLAYVLHLIVKCSHDETPISCAKSCETLQQQKSSFFPFSFPSS